MNKQQLLLIMLMEECDELSQRASKALRFGLNEVQEGQSLTNARRIIYEFNDLVSVLEELTNAKAGELIDDTMLFLKKEKIEKWLAYSEEQGVLTE